MSRALRTVERDVKAALALLPLVLFALAVASWLSTIRPAGGQMFFQSPLSPPPSPTLRAPTPGAPGTPAVTPAQPAAKAPATVPAPTPPPPETVTLDLPSNPIFIAIAVLIVAVAVGVGLWLWTRPPPA